VQFRRHRPSRKRALLHRSAREWNVRPRVERENAGRRRAADPRAGCGGEG
jgi:hypothetical protein